MTVRLGNQTPTQSFVLPYNNTLGNKAIELYNKTGNTAQEWQELLLYDILATNEEGLYTHTKFGYAVPRRNGKNEIVIMREMYGLVSGEHILHTAHRSTTSHSSWERLYDALTKANINITSEYRALGRERIEVEGGGKIEFRTRTSKGGLGEGFDLLVIDEAQEYQDDQETALKYVVTDSNNPQTIFCGTPPTIASSGTVFIKLRNTILSGKGVDSAWEEWSVDKISDPNDVDLWYLTNPSLGTVLTERKIRAEIGEDNVDFNIQRLGLWLQTSLKSAISEREWKDLILDKEVALIGNLFVGIKYGVSGDNVALSIAVKTDDDKFFIESIDCQPIRNGNEWIIKFIAMAHTSKILVDGVNGVELLKRQLKEYGVKKKIEVMTVKDVIGANATFEQSVFSKELYHKDQPSLSQVAFNCEKRAIGTNGGFGYKAIYPEMEIALLESVILAIYGLKNAKKRSPQRMSC